MTLSSPQTRIFFHFRGFISGFENVFFGVLLMKKWVWLGAESNRRHVDFQSTALPTELPSRDRRQSRVASWGSHYPTIWLEGKAA